MENRSPRPLPLWRRMGFVLLCALCFTVQRTLLQNTELFSCRVNLSFLPGLCALCARNRGKMSAGLCGTIYGFLWDTASGASFCTGALMGLIVGYAQGLAAENLMKNRFSEYTVLALTGSVITALCSVLTAGGTWKTLTAGMLLRNFPLEAILSSLLALLLYVPGNLLLGVRRGKEDASGTPPDLFE